MVVMASDPDRRTDDRCDSRDLVGLLERLVVGQEEQREMLRGLVGEQRSGSEAPEVLTLDEAARFLRVGRPTAHRFLDRHGLIVSVEGRRRVSRAALLDALRPPAAKETRTARGPGRRGDRRSPVFVLAND